MGAAYQVSQAWQAVFTKINAAKYPNAFLAPHAVALLRYEEEVPPWFLVVMRSKSLRSKAAAHRRRPTTPDSAPSRDAKAAGSK